jgi:hypothetical protein
VNGSLLAIHQEAEDKHDAHLEDFLESEFLDDQVIFCIFPNISD